MGKYMRQCRGTGEMAAMEATQVVGVRTRSRAAAAAAAKRTKAAEAECEGYLQLRSRKLFMAPRIARTTVANSGSSSTGGCRMSRCAAASFEEVAGEEEKEGGRCRTRSGDSEGGNDLESSVSNSECKRERREATPSSELSGKASDLESEAGKKSPRHRSPEATRSPAEAEIEEFFAAAEREELERFKSKYNFDVLNEVPMEGRYDWIRLSC